MFSSFAATVFNGKGVEGSGADFRSSRVAMTKLLLFPLCLLPLGLLILRALQNDLGANPVEALTHGTGDWALRFLLLTLAVTPLRKITGWGWLLRFRRMLGLFAFFYAVMHLAVYLWIDQSFLWSEIAADIIKRPYITVGFTSFLILSVLAATSPKPVARRMGRRWKSVHRLTYAAALLSVLHFMWLVKIDYREPLAYLAILIVLMSLRLKFFETFFRK